MNLSSNLVLNQFDYFNDLDKFFNKQLLLNLKSDFEKLDYEIFKSRERYENGWSVKDFRKRTVITPFGDVTFCRRRYFNKSIKKYKCLVDDNLQLLKYKRITNALKILILNYFGSGCSYKDIQNFLYKANLSLQSISNIVKHTKITDEIIDDSFFKIPKNIDENTEFHIETDDTFFSLKENRHKVKYRLRLVVVHNGVICLNGKNMLKNKTFFYILKKQGKQIHTPWMIKKIKDHIQKFYNIDLSDIKNAYVHGDAANWIKNLANSLGRKFVLDKFHLFKEIRQVFNFVIGAKTPSKNSELNKEIYYELTKMILKGEITQFLEAIENLKVSLKQINYYKYNDFKTLYNYIKNNFSGIKNINYNFGSSHIEGQISCLIKQLFAYGKKIYSKESFKNILKIKSLKTNGYNFNEILLIDAENRFFSNVEENYDYEKIFSVAAVNAKFNENDNLANKYGKFRGKSHQVK